MQKYRYKCLKRYDVNYFFRTTLFKTKMLKPIKFLAKPAVQALASRQHWLAAADWISS